MEWSALERCTAPIHCSLPGGHWCFIGQGVIWGGGGDEDEWGEGAWPSRKYTLCSRTPMDGKNYVSKIWRGMCKVSVSTIPVSRREGGRDLEGGREGGVGGRGEGPGEPCSSM